MISMMLMKQESYEKNSLKQKINRIFNHFIDERQIILENATVLLKPNLLSASLPEKRITTDPAVVESIAEAVLDRGGHPIIADSPGLDRFSSVAEKTGMNTIAQKLHIPVVELTNPTPIPVSRQARFHRIELSQTALDADFIINIPKLKTHAQMLFTLGVKNLFGTVVGQQKASWHYNVGLNRDIFAELHLDIYEALSPTLTIIDGIWGMDGHGPGNGNPHFFGLLAASDDAINLDVTICRMLHVKLKDFPLYRAAQKRDLILDESCIFFNCEEPDFFDFQHVNMPNLDSLHLLPPFLDVISKRYLVSRPVHKPEKCIRCRKCEEICAAQAVTLDSYGKLNFDYNKCIRCFCCQEVCPNDAIEFRKGLVLKLLDLIKSRC